MDKPELSLHKILRYRSLLLPLYTYVVQGRGNLFLDGLQAACIRHELTTLTMSSFHLTGGRKTS